MKDGKAINDMHNLIFLLSLKTHQVFQARVIHQIIDQNWDLKGLRSVLDRLLETMGLGIKDCPASANLDKYLEKTINAQNLQSAACIKAIGSFLRKAKNIVEDDLHNPIKTYQTTFDFLKEDIERYREQRIKHQCFQVLHPWAYDLNTVDMKYVVNTNLEAQITSILSKSVDAQIFWLTFFKAQLACPGDEFLEAIRQSFEMIGQGTVFAELYAGSYLTAVEQREYVIDLEKDGDFIIECVEKVVQTAMSEGGARFSPFTHQIKLGSYTGMNSFVDTLTLEQYGYKYKETRVNFPEFAGDTSPLGDMRVLRLAGLERCDMQRRVSNMKPSQLPQRKLVLRFEAVDTEELRDIEIKFDGDKAFYKVGEGETCHFHVPNDKKLWETQFLICQIGGQYYIRDVGFVHCSRIKLDTRVEVQLQRGALVDLGKVVHYHFDKAIHRQEPDYPVSEGFFSLRKAGDFDVDSSDFAHLRARPTWVSAEEHIENIQNEINLNADDEKPDNLSSLGRSNKRDIQIKLKAVSADHCNIKYADNKGWTISERGKTKASSNGTYVFLKTFHQMSDHKPSDLVPLQEGMVISFVNYELRVSYLPKSDADIAAQKQAMAAYFDQQMHTLRAASMASPQIVEVVPTEEEHAEAARVHAEMQAHAPIQSITVPEQEPTPPAQIDVPVEVEAALGSQPPVDEVFVPVKAAPAEEPVIGDAPQVEEAPAVVEKIEDPIEEIVEPMVEAKPESSIKDDVIESAPAIDEPPKQETIEDPIEDEVLDMTKAKSKPVQEWEAEVAAEQAEEQRDEDAAAVAAELKKQKTKAEVDEW